MNHSVAGSMAEWNQDAESGQTHATSRSCGKAIAA
jgi:hypothetical protein